MQVTAPNDLQLEFSLPTKEMHISTKIPVSVFLKLSDGTIIPAHKDIVIDLDFEESLIKPAQNKIIIEKGKHYATTSKDDIETKSDMLRHQPLTNLHFYDHKY